MTPFFTLLILAAFASNSKFVNADPDDGLITQTVYGFLDFTTTIGNTVMVFSPNTAPPLVIPDEKKNGVKLIETRPSSNDQITNAIKPTKSLSDSKKDSKSKPIIGKSSKIEIVSSKVDTILDNESVTKTPLNDKRKVFSKVEIKEADSETIESSFIAPSKSKVISKQFEIRQSDVPHRVYNDLDEPEYDFLSRQPSEYVEESYKVVNLKPSANSNHKNRGHNSKYHSQKDAHPTGLVTKLSGTIVKEGLTTIHETSVIGTFISDKYAQVLQSSSHVYKNNNKPKISPSSTVRILKTAAPSSSRISYNANANANANANTPATSAITPSNRNRRLESQTGKFHNRFRNKNRNDEQQTTEKVLQVTTSQTFTKSNRNDNKNRRNNKNVSGAHRTTTTQPPSNSNDPLPRRGFKKQKVSSSLSQSEPSTTLYKFKLNRAPGRWQYKTSPKPRVTIRKSAGSDTEEDVSTVVSKASQISEDLVSNDILSSQNGEPLNQESSVPITDTAYNELESEATATLKPFPAETLNVEISTPSDFKETYYEIATIKTPYTFQVGTVKNTRFITVTSTFEKSLEPETKQTISPMEPLTENIYTAPQTNRDVNFLDTSIATLSPLYLSSDEETVPLETMTETYSMVQKILKTQILPVIKEGQNASSLTLVHTYRVTRFVTATKTLPPSDAYQFVASKRLKEFNTKLDEAGSEHHLELEFGDLNEDDDDIDQDDIVSEDDASIFDFLNNDGSRNDQNDGNRPKPDENKNSKKKNNKNNEHPSRNSQISPEQLQQLALLGLLNPAAAAQLPQIITTSKPRITLETLYESHLIPFFNGHSTSYSTITKSIGTRPKTDYELVTTTLALPLPPVPVNPLFPQQQQQQQFQITTAPIVTQTVATQINSKVLKLTFGAKTAYTTLFSTRVVPTILTTFITTSLPVQQTAAFPGYYPAPFAPYPFVG